ncbi:hypothetical protein BKA70DRAFT_1240642 [Coprinopsis sp. MPI-PUGE-AT-0042]|nr:hypothetical protein BKA70DRAFT_1240642 [Coprinopsis sp. MPI-PUGE-AT-0042]
MLPSTSKSRVLQRKLARASVIQDAKGRAGRFLCPSNPQSANKIPLDAISPIFQLLSSHTRTADLLQAEDLDTASWRVFRETLSQVSSFCHRCIWRRYPSRLTKTNGETPSCPTSNYPYWTCCLASKALKPESVCGLHSVTLDSILTLSPSVSKLRQFEIRAADPKNSHPTSERSFKLQDPQKIVAAFPQLERPWITVGATYPPSPASMRVVGAQYPQLRDLAVGVSPIQAPQSVALFLSKVFHNLASLGYSRKLGYPPGRPEKWEEACAWWETLRRR